MYNGLKKPLWSHRYVCFLGPIRNSARVFYFLSSGNFSHRQRSNADDLSGLDQVPEGKFV